MEEKILNELVEEFNKEECNRISYSSCDEMKYVYLYAYYYYGNADSSNCMDIDEGLNYSRKYDNVIFGGLKDNRIDEGYLDLITANYQDNSASFDKDAAFTRIHDVFDILRKYKIKSDVKIVEESKIENYLDRKDIDSQKICIKLITNYQPKSIEEKENIFAMLQDEFKHSSYFPNVIVSIIFEEDLNELVEGCTASPDGVKSFTFTLDKPNNYLEFGDEKSLIVNIRASSLKNNYRLFGKKGLFAMNLRFYVKSVKVDSGIVNSIKTEGYNFWYKNNGIIIICDDYSIKDNTITIKNGSIVNGGQTTRMIGETDFNEDFSLTCKIIKNKYENLGDKTEFVAGVAEASNTQKPIKPQDLIANRKEQRLLKLLLQKENVFIQIKRGEVPNKVTYPDAWQKTTNTVLAQLLFSGVYQTPGVSKNSPASLFANTQKYNTIFNPKKDYDASMLVDMLYVQTHLKKWSKKVSNLKNKDNATDEEKDFLKTKQGLVSNGFYYINAMVFFIFKMYFSKEYVNLLNSNILESDIFKKIWQAQTFNHKIFNKPFSELEKPLYDLFEFVVEQYLIPKFKEEKEENPVLVYSNYTKTDSNYAVLAKFILGKLESDYPIKLKMILEKIMYQENDQDKNLSLEMVRNSFEINDNQEQDNGLFFSEEDSIIYNELLNYRKGICLRDKVKNNKVFTDDEIKDLIATRPTTIEELKESNCFVADATERIRKYGNDILEIINKVK